MVMIHQLFPHVGHAGGLKDMKIPDAKVLW